MFRFIYASVQGSLGTAVDTNTPYHYKDYQLSISYEAVSINLALQIQQTLNQQLSLS